MMKNSYPEIFSMVRLYCHANHFDTDRFKRQVEREDWKALNPTFKEDFQRVIDERLITMDEYAALTDIDFETDDELFEYLQKIFDCVYNDGPDPYAMDDISA